MIYLATPYSHDDPAVREYRFQAANRAASKLMMSGLHVFSPISHSHPIALAGGLPLGWGYWKEFDRKTMSICDKVVVLKLDGWKESIGVTAEIAMADALGIEVQFAIPEVAL